MKEREIWYIELTFLFENVKHGFPLFYVLCFYILLLDQMIYWGNINIFLYECFYLILRSIFIQVYK